MVWMVVKMMRMKSDYERGLNSVVDGSARGVSFVFFTLGVWIVAVVVSVSLWVALT